MLDYVFFEDPIHQMQSNKAIQLYQERGSQGESVPLDMSPIQYHYTVDGKIECD